MKGGEFMEDTEVIELLCQAQDINKFVRLQATNEEQIKQTDKFEENIQNKFKSLYVK